MHICYVVGGLPFGGIETWLLELAKGMLSRGHRVTVINLSGTGELTERYVQEGVTVVCPAHSKSVLKTYRLDTALKLRKLLKELAPDIIHTSHFSANCHARIAAMGIGVPVITHVHNTKKHRKRSRDVIDGLLSYATDMFISVSSAVESEATQGQNRAGVRTEVAYNTVDHARFDVVPADLEAVTGVPLRGPVVVAVCRLEVQKNIELLVRSFAHVRNSLPDASLLVVGEGTQGEKIREAVLELGLSGAVFLVGFRSDVPEILRAVEQTKGIFAMPSAYEGLPIAAIESMICGLPGVISKYVPIKEIAPDALIECDTTEESVSQAIVSVLGDSTKYDEMGKAARDLGLHFRHDAYCNKLEGWYRELIA